MNANGIILVLISVYLLVTGLKMLFTGSGFNTRGFDKYTEESVKKYMKHGGIGFILIGFFCIFLDLDTSGMVELPDGALLALVILVFLSIVYLLFSYSRLVKKGSKRDLESREKAEKSGKTVPASAEDEEFIDED